MNVPQTMGDVSKIVITPLAATIVHAIMDLL